MQISERGLHCLGNVFPLFGFSPYRQKPFVISILMILAYSVMNVLNPHRRLFRRFVMGAF